jgi:hypothetical protein
MTDSTTPRRGSRTETLALRARTAPYGRSGWARSGAPPRTCGRGINPLGRGMRRWRNCSPGPLGPRGRHACSPGPPRGPGEGCRWASPAGCGANDLRCPALRAESSAGLAAPPAATRRRRPTLVSYSDTNPARYGSARAGTPNDLRNTPGARRRIQQAPRRPAVGSGAARLDGGGRRDPAAAPSTRSPPLHTARKARNTSDHSRTQINSLAASRPDRRRDVAAETLDLLELG